MIIKDLDYLQDLTQTNEVVGGVGVDVGAYAGAKGENTYTKAQADTKAGIKLPGNDLVTLAVGKVSAVAVAEDPNNPQTSTSGFANGDGNAGGGGLYAGNTYKFGDKSLSVGFGLAVGVDVNL